MVQGVGFRFFTIREARRAGVVGYVRNRHDGDVELEAEGPEEAVSALLEAVHRGPPGGRVLEVTTEPREVLGSESAFDVRF